MLSARTLVQVSPMTSGVFHLQKGFSTHQSNPNTNICSMCPIISELSGAHVKHPTKNNSYFIYVSQKNQIYHWIIIKLSFLFIAVSLFIIDLSISIIGVSCLLLVYHSVLQIMVFAQPQSAITFLCHTIRVVRIIKRKFIFLPCLFFSHRKIMANVKNFTLRKRK